MRTGVDGRTGVRTGRTARTSADGPTMDGRTDPIADGRTNPLWQTDNHFTSFKPRIMCVCDNAIKSPYTMLRLVDECSSSSVTNLLVLVACALLVSHPLVRGYVSVCPDGAPSFPRAGRINKFPHKFPHEPRACSHRPNMGETRHRSPSVATRARQNTAHATPPARSNRGARR